jgi:BirA family biotin operon repressor/biotin-[acetyl-CoA-carboxylase] ligase
MDISRRLIAEGEPHGTVIVADFQEAGRGRISGRQWEMEEKTNLPFSILLRYPKIENIPVALTLRTGLAVSLAIVDFAPCLKGNVFVKWPNDIIINSKKAVGILCEAEDCNVHVGIGINVAQKVFPSHLAKKATSIALEAKWQEVKEERFDLLEKVLVRIHDEFAVNTTANNGSNWKENLEKRLYKKGSPVVFMEGIAGSGKERKGILSGITNEGELLIIPHGETKAHSFISGELTFE